MTAVAWALALAIVTGAAGASLAADKPADKKNTDRLVAFVPPDHALDSNSLIGARVQNRQGKDVGEVERLVIDAKSGRVSHVVLGLGGLAGVGEQKVVVPWSTLVVGTDPTHAQRTVVAIDERTLDQAQKWEDPEQRRVRQDPASASPRTTPPLDRTAPSGPGPRQ